MCSQELAIGPIQSQTNPSHTLKVLRSTSKFPKLAIPFRFFIKHFVYISFHYHARHMFGPSQPPPNVIAVMLFGERYNLRRCSSYNCLHHSVTVSLSHPNILLSAMFSIALNLCSFLWVIFQVSQMSR